MPFGASTPPARLKKWGIFNVKEYGAKGDGTTDDTAAIQAALDAIRTGAVGGRLYFPKGTYMASALTYNFKLSAGVFAPGLQVHGQGKEVSILKKITGTTTTLLKIYNDDTSAAGKPADTNFKGDIRHMTLYGSASNIHNILELKQVALFQVEDCIVWNTLGKAIFCDGSLVFGIRDCILAAGVSSIYARQTAGAGEGVAFEPNAITVERCYMVSADWGIDYADGNMLVVRDCVMEFNGDSGVDDSGAIKLAHGAGSQGIQSTVESTWFEGNSGWAVDLVSGAVVIDRCFVYDNGTGLSKYFRAQSGATKMHIRNLDAAGSNPLKTIVNNGPAGCIVVENSASALPAAPSPEGNAIEYHRQPIASVSYFADKPSCRATGTATGTANDTPTAIPFGAETWDDPLTALHSTVTNNTRFTAPLAGIYRVSGSVSFAANATGVREAKIRAGGITDHQIFTIPNCGASELTRIPVSGEVALAAAGYIEIYARQTSTGTLDATGDITVEYVRPLAA